LEKISFPNELEYFGKLGAGNFFGCASLAKVDLSSTNVEVIGNGTFSCRTGLKEFK
jgi:hypothetical protein